MFDCTGVGLVTVRVNNNHSSDNGGWGSAHVTTGRDSIPSSFGFTLTDTATGVSQSFVRPKGDGSANTSLFAGAGVANVQRAPIIRSKIGLSHHVPNLRPR